VFIGVNLWQIKIRKTNPISRVPGVQSRFASKNKPKQTQLLVAGSWLLVAVICPNEPNFKTAIRRKSAILISTF
jgi:CRISPR/Cas system CSM-associated protein Csm3 (group 7 of RAMP superfamily)